MLGLINVNRTLPPQTRHAERPAQGHLNPGHIEWQGMEIKKPFADEISHILKAKYFLVKHGDPFGAATADQLLDRLRPFQVKRLKSQKADVARPIARMFKGTALHVPANGA